MMKTKRKWMAMLLALCLLLGMIPVTTQAAQKANKPTNISLTSPAEGKIKVTWTPPVSVTQHSYYQYEVELFHNGESVKKQETNYPFFTFTNLSSSVVSEYGVKIRAMQAEIILGDMDSTTWSVASWTGWSDQELFGNFTAGGTPTEEYKYFTKVVGTVDVSLPGSEQGLSHTGIGTDTYIEGQVGDDAVQQEIESVKTKLYDYFKTNKGTVSELLGVVKADLKLQEVPGEPVTELAPESTADKKIYNVKRTYEITLQYDKQHDHIWSDNYFATPVEHYKKCMVEDCSERTEIGAHQVVDGACTVCQFSAIEVKLHWDGTKVVWQADQTIDENAIVRFTFKLYKETPENPEGEVVAAPVGVLTPNGGVLSGERDFAGNMASNGTGKYWVEVRFANSTGSSLLVAEDISGQKIYYGYQTVNQINLENASTTVTLGAKPEFTAAVTAEDSEKYEIYREEWTGDNGKTMTSDASFNETIPEANRITVFEEGVTYSYNVSVRAKGESVLSKDASVTLNGSPCAGAVLEKDPETEETQDGSLFRGTFRKLHEEKCEKVVTEYDLWVDGVRVTSENASDVLGAADGDKATVTYDAATNTLTLNGANITKIYKSDAYSSGIYTRMESLKLNLVGSSKIALTDSGAYGIDAGSSYGNGSILNISGSGTLDITSKGIAVYAGELRMSSGTLTATSERNGIQVRKTMTIDGGKVTGKTTSTYNSYNGIFAFGGIMVTAGEVTGEGGTAINSRGGITVSGGTVTGSTATSNGIGIQASGTLTVTGGTVTGTGGLTGIEAKEIIASGGKMTGEGSACGIRVTGTGTLNVSGDAEVSGTGTVTDESAMLIGASYGGILADKITVDGGKVTGSAEAIGDGICGTDMTLNDGEVIGESTKSIGISANNLQVNGGKITGKGAQAAIASINSYETEEDANAAKEAGSIRLPEGYLAPEHIISVSVGKNEFFSDYIVASTIADQNGTPSFDVLLHKFTGVVTEISLPEKHVHNSDGAVDHKDATCTEAGVVGGTYCTICNEGKEAAETVIPALGHDMKPFKDAVEPTCTTEGKTAVTKCSRCDHTEGGAGIPALGHDMKPFEDAVEPTCTTEGKTAITKCSRCGHTEGGVTIPALGHNNGGIVAHKDATCTETGVVGGTYCTRCNDGKEAAEAVIPALGHNADGVVTHKDATCTEAGVVGGTYCTRCNEGKEAAETVIPALGHDMKPFKDAVEPTCTTEGKTAVTKCSRCDHTEGGAVISALGHDMKPFKDAVEATCTTEGKTAITKCSRCDHTEGGVTIPALGHNNGGIVAHRDATCTEAGVVGGTYCTRCDDGREAAEKTIPARGHSYGDWTDAKDGRNHVKTCTVCGAEEKEAHQWNEGEVTKAPTIWIKGEKTHSCTVCGAQKKEEIPTLIQIITPTDTDAKKTQAGLSTPEQEVKNVLEGSISPDLKNTVDAELQKAAEENKEAKVRIEVDIDKLDEANADETKKEKIDQVKSAMENKGSQLGSFFDIRFLVKVEADGHTTQVGTIVETKEALSYSVAIPRELQKQGRVFTIVRVYEDQVEELPTTVENGKAVFQTDKASVYALSYKDTVSEKPDAPDTENDKKENDKTENGSTGNDNDKTENGSTGNDNDKTENGSTGNDKKENGSAQNTVPATADRSVILLWIAMVLFSGTAATTCIVSGKKKS